MKRLVYIALLAACGAEEPDKIPTASHAQMQAAVQFDCISVWFTPTANPTEVETLRRKCLESSTPKLVDDGIAGAKDDFRRRWVLAAAVANETHARVSYRVQASVDVQCADARKTEKVTLGEVFGSPSTREAFALAYELPCQLADGKHSVTFLVDEFDSATYSIELTSGTE